MLQECSAAIGRKVGLELLVEKVRRKQARQTLGYVSLSMSICLLVGLLLCGVVYEKARYFAVFYKVFSFVAPDLFFRLALIEKKCA